MLDDYHKHSQLQNFLFICNKLLITRELQHYLLLMEIQFPLYRTKVVIFYLIVTFMSLMVQLLLMQNKVVFGTCCSFIMSSQAVPSPLGA